MAQKAVRSTNEPLDLPYIFLYDLFSYKQSYILKIQIFKLWNLNILLYHISNQTLLTKILRIMYRKLT